MEGIDALDLFGVPGGPARGNQVRRQVLEQARQLRVDGTRPGTPWAGSELMIPELDYYVLVRRFPDLASPDAEIRLKAWKRFLGTSLADPYRVNPKNLARRPSPRP
jgi:hypothetical protein